MNTSGRIHPRLRAWVASSLLVGVVVLPARAGDATAELRQVLSHLPDRHVTCGAMIVDLQTGKTVYSRSPEASLVPASNEKLLVMAAAIEMLSPDAVFRTILAVRGDDLVIIGGGDPALGDERLAEARGEVPLAFLDRWARALQAAGRDSMTGDVVVDATVFDDHFAHPEWEPADLVKWYGAPVGGLNLCGNCVELTVWPDPGGDSAARWSLLPPCSAVEVINRCRSTPGAKKSVPVVGRKPGTFELVLSGKVGRRAKLQSVAIPDPLLFAATAIREGLEARGVTVAGGLRFERVLLRGGHLPADCVIIVEESTPLADVLRRVGVNSQNMFAEALMKRLGYEWARSCGGDPADGTGRAVGSWPTGRQALNGFLTRTGCDPAMMVISDASGLSRANRVSAADFVRVLRYMYAHPRRELFVSSLAGNRTGGTLRKRMQNLAGDVCAKTGYMRGIRTLSGYVVTRDGRWYAFSVLFNGFKGSSAPYNKLHDRVCEVLSRSSGS